MKTKNQTFQYLKAIAILMVIDDHSATRIGILPNLFPYNSFYMPLFVFISGYFFRDRGMVNNIKNKTERLLLPYMIWLYLSHVLSYVLDKYNIVHWYVPLRNVPYSLVNMFTVGPISSIIGAAWFCIMLFWVSILYIFLHKLLMLEKPVMSYIFLGVSIIAGFVSLQLCMKGYQTSMIRLALLRAIWFLQFYHMGWMFGKYWEKHLEKIPVIAVISLCIMINVVLICIYGGDINFTSTTYMASFHSWWLPLITSFTGILFWYEVMHFAAKRIGEVKVISYIADNTFTIMCAHLALVTIPNFYVYAQILRGSTKYPDFPVRAFLDSAWTRYNANTNLIGFFCGLVGSHGLALLINKVMTWLTVGQKKHIRVE